MSKNLYIFFLCLVWLTDCSGEETIGLGTEKENMAVLSLSTRDSGLLSAGTEEERIVKTLRMMVFDETGIPVFNKIYTDVTEVLKQEGGVYNIREQLPQYLQQIKVCLIANEPSRWRLGRLEDDAEGIITYSRLKNKYIDFENDYPSFMDGIPAHSMNVEPEDGNFVMFAEISTLFGEGGATITSPIELVRLIAKVTLILSYDLTQISGFDYDAGDLFSLDYAMIKNQPLESYLTSKNYQMEEDLFLSTSEKRINVTETVGSTIRRMDPLTFYIPEHWISSDNFLAGIYTYLSVTATYKPAGKKSIIMSYKIPLGNGVQKIFNDNTYSPTVYDYTIMRNYHYNVNGRITNLGDIEGMQLNLLISEWNTGEQIEVNRPAPYLNVSEIIQSFEVDVNDPAFSGTRSDKIFFWTNQPEETIRIEAMTCQVYMNSTNQLLGSLDNLYGDAEFSYLLNIYDGESDLFIENNGYVDLNLIFGSFDWTNNRIVCTFKLCTGNLKREIQVTYHKKN